MKAVVALDGSEYSKRALRFAVETLDKNKWELHLLHVIPTADILGIESVAPPALVAELMQQLEENAKQILEEGKKVAEEAGFKVETVIRKGHPGKEIVRYAEEIDADLIVTGTRGLSGIKALILGSVARYVSDHAHCPVLVVRPKEGKK